MRTRAYTNCHAPHILFDFSAPAAHTSHHSARQSTLRCPWTPRMCVQNVTERCADESEIIRKCLARNEKQVRVLQRCRALRERAHSASLVAFLGWPNGVRLCAAAGCSASHLVLGLLLLLVSVAGCRLRMLSHSTLSHSTICLCRLLTHSCTVLLHTCVLLRCLAVFVHGISELQACVPTVRFSVLYRRHRFCRGRCRTTSHRPQSAPVINCVACSHACTDT